MEKPETKMMKARDVVPGEYGIWCTVGGGEPFVNGIELVSWSDDFEKLWFMLGTHNFYSAKPDEEIEVVPTGREPKTTSEIDWRARQRAEHAELIAGRPGPELRARIAALRVEQEKVKQELARMAVRRHP